MLDDDQHRDPTSVHMFAGAIESMDTSGVLATTIFLAATAILAAAELVIDWRGNGVMMRMGLGTMAVINLLVLIAGAGRVAG
jgi:hypothetical protein